MDRNQGTDRIINIEIRVNINIFIIKFLLKNQIEP
jgi:hypothetical protein